MIMNNLTQLKH